MRFSKLLFVALLSLSACQGGQMPQSWNEMTQNVQSWGDQGEGGSVAPMQKNSDFEQRLQTITQKLDTNGNPNGVVAAPRGEVTESAAVNTPVKVALVVPLSGPQKSLGESMLVAGQMAMQDFRERSVELLPRDSGTTAFSAREAIDAAAKDGAKLILGPVFAEQVKAAQPGNIPLIGFTTDASAAGNNVYVMGFLPYEQTRRVADFAAERKARDLVVVAPDTPYGRAVARTATQYNKLPTKAIIAASTDSADSMIAKIAPLLSPETAILIAYDGAGTRRLVAGLKAMNVTPQNHLIMGTGVLDDPALATARELEGVFFASAPTAQRARFEKRYRAVAGKAPVRLASLAYDATALALTVAKAANDPYSPFPKSQITDPSGFAGIDGVFRFGQDGLVTRNLAVLTWTAGQLREVAPAAGSF